MSKLVQLKKGTENIFPNNYETEWTYLPLINDWSQYKSNVYRKSQYKKINNIVYIEGLVANDSSNPNSTFATLPKDFRPTSVVQFPVVSSLSQQTNGNKVLLLRIAPDGSMSIQGTTLSTGIWISLSGVYFFTK